VSKGGHEVAMAKDNPNGSLEFLNSREDEIAKL
jgi:hypothetical protein